MPSLSMVPPLWPRLEVEVKELCLTILGGLLFPVGGWLPDEELLCKLPVFVGFPAMRRIALSVFSDWESHLGVSMTSSPESHVTSSGSASGMR
mmetsp:Transcript_7913/g.19327  ORF Transcript_7913/g.19327 Transcript_7913/m.19327 type:complete len:93 (-) Transcript_7913:219-497(-)